MKLLPLAAMTAAAASPALLPSAAQAQAQRVGIGGWTAPPVPRHHGGGLRGHRGFFGFPAYVIEREVPVIVEVPVPVPVPVAAPAPEPPPPPRKPFVVGASYDSLPGSCLKSIEDGGKATYYYCSGEWYRQLGKASYKAVARP